MQNKVLFFSSVSDLKDFDTQGFYIEDITILKNLGYEVICTNKILDFITSDYKIAFLYFYKWSLFPSIFARLRFKKVYYTGGIDDLSIKVQSNFFKRLIYRFLFLANFLFASKVNIVSETDYINALSLLSKVGISSKKKRFIYFLIL